MKVSVGRDDGDVKISAIKAGTGYIEIEDKYKQTENIRVKIQDAILSLDEYKYKVKANGGNFVIPIRDYYKDIIKKGKSNENLSFTIETKQTSSGREKKSISITPKKEGTTVIYLEYAEGNKRTVEVSVVGSGGDEIQMKKVVVEMKVKK